MGKLTAHVLDTANGCPAAGILAVRLYRLRRRRRDHRTQAHHPQPRRPRRRRCEGEEFQPGATTWCSAWRPTSARRGARRAALPRRGATWTSALPPSGALRAAARQPWSYSTYPAAEGGSGKSPIAACRRVYSLIASPRAGAPPVARHSPSPEPLVVRLPEARFLCERCKVTRMEACMFWTGSTCCCAGPRHRWRPWIGSSFYFVFLDKQPGEAGAPDLVAGDSDSGPCGGGYTTRRNAWVAPKSAAHLHWFYWGFSTWLTGCANGALPLAGTFLIDRTCGAGRQPAPSPRRSASLVVFWAVYDAICRDLRPARAVTASSASASPSP